MDLTSKDREPQTMNPDGKEQIWQSKETVRALPSGHRFLLGYTSCFLEMRFPAIHQLLWQDLGMYKSGSTLKKYPPGRAVALVSSESSASSDPNIDGFTTNFLTGGSRWWRISRSRKKKKKTAMLGLRSHSSSLWCIIFRLFMTTPSLLKMFFSVFFTASQDHGCLYCAAKQREKCGNKVNQQHFV